MLHVSPQSNRCAGGRNAPCRTALRGAARRGPGIPTALLGALCLALLLATPVAAQQPWSISVDLPVALQFTDDDGDADAEPSSLSGYDLAVFSPWYVGVGLTGLNTGIEGFALNGQNLDLAYTIVNLLGKFTIGNLVLGLGVGGGSITFDPKTSTNGSLEQTFSGGDVRQTIIFAGWKVTESLDIHVSQHAILAEGVQVETRYNGLSFEDEGDIGAIMTTLGLGYYF